jgi:hypothetical protein
MTLDPGGHSADDSRLSGFTNNFPARCPADIITLVMTYLIYAFPTRERRLTEGDTTHCRNHKSNYHNDIEFRRDLHGVSFPDKSQPRIFSN